MPDYRLYQLKISVLTPLHIGDGEELLHEYDYAIHAGRTWRINEAALLDAQQVDDPLQATVLAQPPARLLQPQDFQEGSQFFRYIIQGTPRSAAEGAQLRAQIKDPFDRPYLPGSSLKGALRTALAWHAWEQKRLSPELARLGRSPKWAAQNYEHELFGPDPNRDLLRALQVSDSQPASAERLMALNVRVLNRSGSFGSPIEVEAIRPDTVLAASLKLDLALFSEWATGRGLRLAGGRWLAELAALVNRRSQERIQQESEWFRQARNGGRPLAFYRQLASLHPGANQCLLQLGWGTGWGDKTLGARLQVDEGFMEKLIAQYGLARGRRQRGEPFPRSRRVAMAHARDQQGRHSEAPAYPLGWVLMEMAPQ